MTARRIHAFDFLRAFAMQLGIVYHVSNFYSVNPDEMATAEKSHSVFFDVLFGIIHPFRMPLFFLMSGFFASLTFKKGEGKVGPFLRVRQRRLLWPFLLSLLFIKPIVDVINLTLYDDFHPSLMEIISFRGTKTGVYWFLYYLMMYSVIAASVGALWKKRKRNSPLIDRIVRAPWAPIVCAFPTAAALMLFSAKWTDIGFGESFVPMPGVFVYYGAFFLFGWWLEGRREDAIESIRARRGLSLALVGVCTITVVVLLRFEDATSHPLHAWLHRACALAYAIGAWSAVFTLIGFAVQHLSARPLSRFLRFVVDASYWTYLVHLPIAIAFTWALIPLRISCFVKAPLVMLLTSFLAQLSYVFIQPTLVGSLLRGGESSSVLVAQETRATLRRLVISTVITVLVASHVWAMLAPYEDWPLGANAMFSFDTPPATDLYNVVFLIEGENGKTRQLNAEEDLQFDEMFLKRQFFAGFYGSTHPRFPQRWSAGDTPDAFEERIDDFGQRILVILERNNVEGVSALRIQIERVNPQDPTQAFESREIARIVPKSSNKKRDPS